MSKLLPVNYEGKFSYNIYLTDSFQELNSRLSEVYDTSEKKVCIVTDSHVEPFYAKIVQTELEKIFHSVFVYVFPAGEAYKTIESINGLYRFLIEQHFDRRDMLAALGGGVVGDMTGYAAATYLRGIDFIQIPTTLLSQTDSSIGGKTGVDFMQYKNMIGAFYMPKLVYMNLSALKTLPKEQLISGFGEILKHGLIKDADYFEWLKQHHDAVCKLRYDALEEMIYRSCEIKRTVVEADPKEKGERALLNFGHTLGHAVEKLSNFSLSHGVCVGLGIVAASYLSKEKHYISEEELASIEHTLANFGLMTRVNGIAAGMTARDILAASKSDKKMEGKQIRFILLERPGRACIYKDLTEEDILKGIRYITGEEQLEKTH